MKEHNCNMEYEEYLDILCKLASDYLPHVRVQFAKKAYDMYQDATVRKIVAAYGEALPQLEQNRRAKFEYVVRHRLEHNDLDLEMEIADCAWCEAIPYRETLLMLFDIELWP